MATQNKKGRSSMVNIVSTTIDTRLIHRQITGYWLSTVGSNILLVVNDTVAKDALRQELLKRMAPVHIHIKFYTVEEAYLWLRQADRLQKIAIVCANPYDIVKLVEAGFPIQKVTIGYMGMGNGKRQVTSNIAVDEADVFYFRRLQNLNIRLEIRKYPYYELEDISKVFEEEW